MKKEKMTIKEFTEGYVKCGTETMQERYIKDNLKVETYLPFALKTTLAESIINTSSYDEKKNIKISSVGRYLLFTRTVITRYTNLTDNVEHSSFLEEYDQLSSSGLLEKIFELIPQREINEFQTILDMTLEDMMTNYASPHTFIASQVERFATLAENLFTPLLDRVNEKLDLLSEKDKEKIIKKLETFLTKAKKQ